MFRLPFALALITTAALPAQIVISRPVPEAAAPSDTIVLRGTFPGGVNSVVFTANVGGFVGVWTATVSPTSVTSTDVVVSVPMMAGFAPPNATPAGNPLGSVHVLDGNGRASAKVPFYFLQGTFLDLGGGNYSSPQTTTLGVGTTPASGIGRVAVSFDLTGGPPTPGNANFIMEAENAAPNAAAVLFVGFPASGPFPMILDGTVVLDLGLPFVPLPAVMTDGQGDAAMALPIPVAGASLTLLNQWAVLDGTLPGGVEVSNGLQFDL